MKKKFCFIIFIVLGCYNGFTQVPIHIPGRVYDFVKDNDTNYLFAMPKPCFEPKSYGWLTGTAFLQEYVAADTTTVYGVAITFNNYPLWDTSTNVQIMMMTPRGVSPRGYRNEYLMNQVDTVTVCRSHPIFRWFRYEDSCDTKNYSNVPCYEFYFDTPQKINRVLDTFYVGYRWNPRISRSRPSVYTGMYDNSLPSHIYMGDAYVTVDEYGYDDTLFFYRGASGYENLWGVAFPISGFRCGRIMHYWQGAYTGDSIAIRWRSAEQGTMFNVRLTGDDGSDTIYVTSDTTMSIANLSNSVCYTLMLRKQCRYCTSNYDTTVYGEWMTVQTFGPNCGGGGSEGVDLSDGVDFTLSPNPARGSVQVVLPSAALGGRLTLCDLSGREMISRTVTGSSLELNISALPAGVYLVKLATSRGTRIHRLLVE